MVFSRHLFNQSRLRIPIPRARISGSSALCYYTLKMPIRMYTDTPPSSPPPTSSHPSENQSHQPTNPPSDSTHTLRTNFIPRPDHLSKQILWIGCSDSDCTETTTLNFLPEEMLEHRNLGNMIIPGDLSSEISIRHAVCELRVKHIVVCGHYGCGIVRASSREGLPGLWSRCVYRVLDVLEL
ncbi:hypothetical protein N7539_009196 [Penicillium diatomitis]|uniref:Carbonic anhydrase n=1 Tax=Penicillium diatomitis TaxID=2819901 RepID=A0A9W9WLZ2_9EURO|nr:uncharacterized protein N7539_009196 [Penicillium diatomitis]KAJ5469578.1 hypothetical protein N7539_009196 [Penicillium diatomitis]